MSDEVKMYLNFFKRPMILSYFHRLSKKVYTPIITLDAEVYKSSEPIEISDIKSKTFEPITKGESWSNKQFDCAWFHFTGKIDKIDPDYVAILQFGGEGCVYKDDVPVQGLTSVLAFGDVFQPIMGKRVVGLDKLNIDENGNIDFYVDAGMNGAFSGSIKLNKASLKNVQIAKCNKEVLGFYYDMLCLWTLRNTLKGESKKQLSKDIFDAKMIAEGFSDKKIQKARELLCKYFQGGNKNPFEITCVGHAHLDLAWLWPLRETKRKAERTMTNALTYTENYPGYVFGSSQPQQYLWLKERHPELFIKIKEAIKEGRVEPQGIMWCEPDTNVPSGESLIRQCYYGKRFFEKEFGYTPDYLWVPDVFGYTASLPRILIGSGADKFMTIKLSWNTINKFPHHSFNWKGIGEGSVLVHMPPIGNYNSNCLPNEIKTVEKNYCERKVSNESLYCFGAGDGGGGAGECNLELITRLEKLSISDLPRVKMGTASEFFAKLERDKEKFPTFEGELYLEKHQGTYTTQGRLKRYMRKTENRIHLLEYVCTQAYLKGGRYPTKEIDEIWQSVLLHQFHDILPGSSINRVYKESHEEFERLNIVINSLLDEALKFLGVGEKQILNPTSFLDVGDIKLDDNWYSYQAKPYSTARLVPLENNNFTYDENTIENEVTRVKFNANGEIVEVFDKINSYNSVKSTFNTMRIYKDKNMRPYNAWDIDIDYMNKPSIVMTMKSHKTYIDGGRVIREQVLTYNNSILKQKIYLERNKSLVFFDNNIEWKEDMKMLRADFYPKNFGKKVVCDIQLGHLERNTNTDTSVDYAQFEICAHKWVDVYDNGYGVALLNDCKYGHRVKDGLISLNLLRSTIHPDKTADRGRHTFKFAIFPHKDILEESRLIEYGYLLNNDLVPTNCEITSLIDNSNSDIIIETIGVNENNEIFARLYESKGKNNKTSLKINFDYAEVCESNLMFENRKQVDINNIDFTDFEIKTLVFKVKI